MHELRRTFSPSSVPAATTFGRAFRLFALAALALTGSCSDLTGAGTKVPLPEKAMRPQTVVLFATPKIIADFANPQPSIDQFLRHYEPLTTRAAETIVIFAVGNSEHIVTYRGLTFWGDSAEWARQTDGKPVTNRLLRYEQIATIVRGFKTRAAATGIKLKVFDQIDPGNEFTFEYWKYNRHPECMDLKWNSYNIRGRLKADNLIYATSPRGIVEGTNCGTFIVDQANRYLRDLAFDGILYGNQFGTRGQWLPDNGPGYTLEEATAIRDFLDYSKRVYDKMELMWFDSYNNVKIEHDVYSFPSEGYGYFDYLMAAGFAVVTHPERYMDNLESKLQLKNRPRILATLDYVDPWYTYKSYTEFPDESANLEKVAIDQKDRIDGVVMFANDNEGILVPRHLIESFATRFFGPLVFGLAP